MCRHERHMEAAIAAAMSSSGVAGRSGKAFRVGAAIFAGSRLLMAQANTYKNTPKLLRFTEWPYFHAESRAILKIGFDACEGTTLYVARTLRNSKTTMSKPCEVCQELIRLGRFKDVYYTNREGEIVKL